LSVSAAAKQLARVAEGAGGILLPGAFHDRAHQGPQNRTAMRVIMRAFCLAAYPV
jgi:hypothetical protein